MCSAGDRRALKGVIEALTTTGLLELDKILIKQLRGLCKQSDACVRTACELLCVQLAKQHAQIRYSTVQVIDDLFGRSSIFRDSFLIEFRTFIRCAVGVKGSPLPPPDHAASKLQELSLDCVRKWNKEFGAGYPQLRLGYDFITSDPELLARVASVELAEAEARRVEIEKHRIARELFTKTKEAIDDGLPDIKENLRKMVTCFRMIMPDTTREFLPHINDQTEDEFEDNLTQSAMISELGLGSVSYRLRVVIDTDEFQKLENEDNSSLFDTLRESAHLLSNRHIPQVKNWQTSLTQSESDSPTIIEDHLKELINLQQQLQAFRRRCDQLYIFNQSFKPPKQEIMHDDLDDEEFEEVPQVKEQIHVDKGKAKAVVTDEQLDDDLSDEAEILPLPSSPKLSIATATASVATSSKLPVPTRPVGPETLDELRQRAPVIEYGPDLAVWGFDEQQLTRYWKSLSGKQDTDHYWIPENDEASYSKSLIESAVFRRPKAVKIHKPELLPCRAPLPSGRLCNRRYLTECPFHGKIIPRDDRGQPLLPNSSNDQNEHIASSSTSSISAAQVDSILSARHRKRNHANTWEDLEAEVNAATGNVSHKKTKQQTSALEDLRGKPKNPLEAIAQIVRKNKSKKLGKTLDHIDIAQRREKESQWL